jgi:glucuronosyltransferase
MENARRTSRIFRDRPQSALDTAIFWTEYVIRHGGAPHLQSAAMKLAWYQYLLIDVITLMLGSVLIFLLIVRKLLRVLLRSKKLSKRKNKQE